MNKSDLGNGNIVTLRDGSRHIVMLNMDTEEFCGDVIVQIKDHGWEKLSNYNEDLTIKGFEGSSIDYSKLDIVKIEKTTHPYHFSDFIKESEV